MKIRKYKRSFVLQHEQSDCGIACLASIIKYHGGETSLENLRYLSGTTVRGTTLLGLYQAATEFGLDAEGLEAENINDLKKLDYPAILHVIINDRLQHFLVFYGYNPDRSICVGDPAKGICKYSSADLNNIWKSKTLLRLKPNQKFKKSKTNSTDKRIGIKNLLKEDLSVLAVSFSVGILLALLNASTAVISQKLIDDVIPQGNNAKLLNSLILLAVLLFVRAGLSYFRNLLLLSQGIEFNTRIVANFYGSLMRLPKVFFDSRKTGELIARMNDTRRIQTVIGSLVGNTLIDVLIIFVSLIVTFFYSQQIGIVIVFAIPVYSALILLFNRSIKDRQREVMRSYAITESHYVDSLKGVSEIKAYNRESYFENVNEKIFSGFQGDILALGKVNINLGLISDIAGTFFIIAVIGGGSFLINRGDLKIGEFVALISISGMVIPAIIRLCLSTVQIQDARIAFDRMFEFTEIEPEDKRDVLETDLKVIDTINRYGVNLKIDNLTFEFPGRKHILNGISMELLSGKMTAIMGASGGGKSTLVQLLQKFYRYSSGSISINGMPFEHISKASWRNLVGVVPQDIKVFNGSLLFNITLSEDPEAFNEAVKFCRRTGFDKYFEALPDGYATVLGEDGTKISGGQKQLLGIARAMFINPRLLLLDEATSALDDYTENFVLSLIKKNLNKFSVLLITHRTKMTEDCDRVYLLNNGVMQLKASNHQAVL